MTQLFNLLLISHLQHAGLALAISLGACMNAGLLYWKLRQQKLFEPQPGWGPFLFKLVVAVLAMSALLLGLMQVMPAWSDGSMAERFLRLGLMVGAGMLVYFGGLFAMGFRLKDFARRGLT